MKTLVLILFISSNTFSQESLEVTPQKDQTVSFFEASLDFGIGLVVTLVLHETGHALYAKIYGCDQIVFNGPNFSKLSLMSVSWDYTRDFSIKEKNTIILGGMEFTSTLESLLYQGVRNNVFSSRAKRLAAATSLVLMLDRHRYIWSGAIQHYAGMSTSSSHDINKMISNNFSTRQGKNFAYGVALGASVLELGLRWEEISYLFQTAIGKNPTPPTVNVLKAGLYPIEGGFLAAIGGEW